jgi:CRP-like cAMP-binding protein
MKPLELSQIADLFEGVALQKSSFHPGERIFEEHDPANSVFFIEQGSVQVGMSDQTIAVLIAGNFFGEHCLAYLGRRVNSVTALEETVVCSIERDEMLKALYATPVLLEAFVTNLTDQQETLYLLLLELELSRRAPRNSRQEWVASGGDAPPKTWK